MRHVLDISGVKWIHLASPNQSEIKSLVEEYDFHELIEDDLLELSTQDKIDKYDNSMFIVLHFPKYNLNIKKYLLNEFNVILGKDYIITITRFKTNHIFNLFEEYAQELKEQEDDEEYKISPYYILYKILDIMFDKSLNMLSKSSRDMMFLEEEMFDKQKIDKKLLESLMIKKRNIVTLKHIFLPQADILQELQESLPKFYEAELDVYLEDLIYKVEKIQNNTSVVFENIESLADTYDTLMSIRTNSIITLLTIFTAITGILTFISGLYGMNVILPYAHSPYMFWVLSGIMSFIIIFILWYFRRKGWI